jgi:CRP-like cAMP-binding protein
MDDMPGFNMADSKQAVAPPRADRSRATEQQQRAALREVALSELGLPSLPKRRVAAGTMIMHPEHKIESLYFIIDGRIRLYRLAPNGEEVFHGHLGPGDCLTCPRILGKHDCHTFAEALVDTTVEVLSKSLFGRLANESVPFNQALIQEVANQIVDLDRRFYETAVMPMKVRLHAELLRIARRRDDGSLTIAPSPTHQELAQRIGAQREAVSKELARLSREGIVTANRKTIVVVREQAIRDEMANWTDV